MTTSHTINSASYVNAKYKDPSYLESLTSAQLYKIGREHGIKGLWGCRKAALVCWIAHHFQRIA